MVPLVPEQHALASRWRLHLPRATPTIARFRGKRMNPYTTEQVKVAVADWNHPLATSRLASSIGIWLDDNNLAVIDRPEPDDSRREVEG